MNKFHKLKPTNLPLQYLIGVIERLTYQNDETGYTVAHLVPKGKSNQITIVGSMPSVRVGESVRLQGLWTNHPKYGRQFEVRSYSVQLPATLEGIRRYLGSGLIKGIGPITASRVVDHFGIETLDIIEKDPQRLKNVPGIGNKRVNDIIRAWERQKQVKEIIIFLQGHGVSTNLAIKIFKQYNANSINIVRSNPYQLVKDIYGIGFKTADKIARQIGLSVDAPTRIQAGLLYTLSKLSDEGHCFASRDQLIDETENLLKIQKQICQEQMDNLIFRNELISDDYLVYLPPFYYAEVGVGRKIRRLQSSLRDHLTIFNEIDWNITFDWLDNESDIKLTNQQKSAIRMSLTEKVSILTGGPGTGKSTITGSIIRLLKSKNGSVRLAAPTGRAAKRLSEATGIEAKTIHRLLEFSPNSRIKFYRNQENPLKADLIIIDETSMVDILLMNNLLSAIEEGTHLLLIGDVDQLPSVGPGNVLRDMIESATIPVTRLNTIFRQSEDSFIIFNAYRINRGEMPIFSKKSRDFFLFSEPNPSKAADWVLELVTRRIPSKFGYDTLNSIQVLSPMYSGAVGVTELNHRLQAELNPPNINKTEYEHGDCMFREGDRVMQIRNDYVRKIFNGDIGYINQIDLKEQTFRVDYSGRIVTYDFPQLDELVHAFATSIHKAQGSEYPVVVIPLITQHYMLLQRNLIYTGISRAKEMVVFVGSRKAIAIAVKNNKITMRNTLLSQRLQTDC